MMNMNQVALTPSEFKEAIMSPEVTCVTLYISDLPKNTSYLDLHELFEKKVGPCKI